MQLYFYHNSGRLLLETNVNTFRGFGMAYSRAVRNAKFYGLDINRIDAIEAVDSAGQPHIASDFPLEK